jgi:hypothetical protein
MTNPSKSALILVEYVNHGLARLVALTANSEIVIR